MDENAIFRLQQGQKQPYDAHTDEEPLDWAHQTARGVLHDLSERGGLRHVFDEIKEHDEGRVATEIVTAAAAIIREGKALYGPGEMEITEEGDYSFTQTIFPEDNAVYGGTNEAGDAFNVFVTDKTQSKGKLLVLIEPPWTTEQEQKKAHERYCSIEMSVAKPTVNEEPMPFVQIAEPSGVILSIQQIPSGFLITHQSAHGAMQQRSELSPEITHYAVISKTNKQNKI